MKKMVVIALLATLLAGCATQQRWRWASVDSDATEADRRRDYAQCDYDATMATASFGAGGYRTMLGDSLERTLRQVEIIHMCMQNKGWHKQQF